MAKEAATQKPNDKRERLIAAAITCFHQYGYARVTLAQIAELAGVPLGNVYYYFKTKSALAKAVVKAWRSNLQDGFAEFDKQPTPQRRLLEFLRHSGKTQAVYAEYGCPLANLARDLRAAEEPGLSELAACVYAGLYEWIERQFHQMGYTRALAKTHAHSFIANLQGAILMAHAHQDAKLIAGQVRNLKRWVGTLEKEMA